jgi:diguanylate cyclase (GGDEF)-like protein
VRERRALPGNPAYSGTLALENRLHELEAVHAQLVAYAADLNRTYGELRFRLQQMTALSAVTTRLARARNVDACTRACVAAVMDVFPGSGARIYLDDPRGSQRLAAESDGPELPADLCDEAAGAVMTRNGPSERMDQETGPYLMSVALEARGKAFGALVVYRSSRSFDENDVLLVELLSGGAAVAITNARLFQETRRLAITDSTTGLFNLRHFRSVLSQETQKARRFGYPIAVMMADLDYFKSFNDRYGHPTGNVALVTVARALTRSLRKTDTLARYGGEEFAAVLPGCDRDSLIQVAEKIRHTVARTPIRVSSDDPSAFLTISIGGAWQTAGECEAAALLANADHALYQAKAMGRNRSHVEP